jgi:hypothetical protein
VAAGQVLIVSADERWLRVLEVTIRLGGAETISRHSIGDALHIPAVDGQHPTAIVMDLGAQTSEQELEDVRGILHDNTLPAVVILPERLVAERDGFVAVGATVLIRPYRPSELYNALWPGEAMGLGAAADADEPLDVDAEVSTDDDARSGEG